MMSSLSSVQSIDIQTYLQNVERELRTTSSYNDNHKNNNNNTTLVMEMSLQEQHRKTMFRTILGMPKFNFNQMMQTVQSAIEYSRMKTFVIENLYPFITTTCKMNWRERAPYFESGFQKAINFSSSKGSYIFSSMARGKVYRGDVFKLIQDLAPELIPLYEEAASPLTEEEVMSYILQQQTELNVKQREAAERCIHYEFGENCKGSLSKRKQRQKSQQMTGLKCEQYCVEYLKDQQSQRNNETIILSNVMVTNIKSFQRNRQLKQQQKCCPSSAYITTTCVDLHKTSAEFDAIVIQRKNNKKNICDIIEIWEAKAKISPSTIFDAFQKKLASIQAILSESSSNILWYGEDALTISPSSCFEFGVFGIDLLPVDQAANQMKIIACNDALAKDMDVVIRSLKEGFVKIDANSVIEKFSSQRVSLLDDVGNVSVKIFVKKE